MKRFSALTKIQKCFPYSIQMFSIFSPCKKEEKSKKQKTKSGIFFKEKEDYFSPLLYISIL